MDAITTDRVEELRVAVNLSHYNECPLINDERLDLLAILNEYADKLRAGSVTGANTAEGAGRQHDSLAGAIPHPGSISRKDEAAYQSIETALRDEDGLWSSSDEAYQALSHIYARLQPPRVTREWVEVHCRQNIAMGGPGYVPTMADIVRMAVAVLRELGIAVVSK